MSVSAIVVTRGDQDIRPITRMIPPDWETLVWDNGAKRVSIHPPGLLPMYSFIEVEDLSVYGRYAAIEVASGDLIYVQDDDCVVSDPQAIVNAWVGEGARRALKGGSWDYRESEGERLDADLSRDFVVCNMPQEFRHGFYEEHALVGFGACFHRDAPERAFGRFWGETFEQQIVMHMTMAIDEPGTPTASTPPIFPPPPPPKFFQRTCDIVFTALTPRVLVDVPKEDLPWADTSERMYRQPEHQAERSRMLDLVKQMRDAA